MINPYDQEARPGGLYTIKSFVYIILFCLGLILLLYLITR